MITGAFRFVVTIVLTLVPAIVLAQNTVRVTVDKATLWRPGFGSTISVVSENQILEVVGRQGDWLEVVVPAGSSQDRRTALISIKQVALASGSLPANGTSTVPSPSRPQLPALPGQMAPSMPGQAPSPGQRVAPPPPPLPPLDTGIRGFGDVSYQFFTARDTFKAVLDQPGGLFFGGGAEYRFPFGLFVQGGIRWFKKTGERVFVLDDEVFPLGIETEVTLVPTTFTAGWRFRSRGAVPYAGGGVGSYRLTETSEFDDPTEKVDERFTSYHFVGGAEFRTRGWLAYAIEAQYTFVPDALSGGLADIYDEHDLGGLDVRFKVVIGR